ncbi:hypothetical protein [Streptomyces broussonetiae]|uniref:MFS transporter n=1 Tax=Streptomyces broussonetiae TaxID=2686304 RepID=A0A6I6N8L5_9ACTN|nr:hypothetical protein [Streptomyces broussonetiae]QHA07712.1 hypothetical protein GQF42_34350 [Streptomyces broussonetiae]
MTPTRTAADIPSLPKLGRTWYERGVRYWLSRARTTVAMLLIMAMTSWFSLALCSGFSSEWPYSVRRLWYGVLAVAACGALVGGWVKQRRDHHKALLDPPTPQQTRLAKQDHNRRVPGRIALGRGLVLLAAPALPVFAAYFVGWMLAWLTVREYPSEVGARRWLEVQNGQSGTS